VASFWYTKNYKKIIRVQKIVSFEIQKLIIQQDTTYDVRKSMFKMYILLMYICNILQRSKFEKYNFIIKNGWVY
jgi:hypothetical protein